MVKKSICYGLILVLLLMNGCTGKRAEDATDSCSKEESESVQEDIDVADATFEESDTESKDSSMEIDFFRDYTSDIETEVNEAINASSTLQEEIENVQKVSDQYSEWAKQAKTQSEMNMSSDWFYIIWDTELNSLWSRFSEAADEDTKAVVLADQRCWDSKLDEIVLETLGPSETGGSIYQCLAGALLEEMAYNRCNVIANELAKIKGEDFIMPKRSIQSTYIDNHGTNEVYNYLSTQVLGQYDDIDAKISIHGLITLEGNFTEKGNDELEFTSIDGDIKGTIRLDGWNGASFEVTESSNDLLSVGAKFEFNFAL